jgi:4-amino-4-deoxychorismate lyase
MLVNGAASQFVNADDRGLAYGDGIFRTLRIRQGKLRNWSIQYKKLAHDCAALNLACPDEATLLTEFRQLIGDQSDGLAKIIVTRGSGMRGYKTPEQPKSTRILSVHPLPDQSPYFLKHGVALFLCNLRFSHQPRLAGIKHLNRLENVLAASECNDPKLPEGLCLDMLGHVIGGTRSNLFMVKDGELRTPDLSRCGVAGVQRDLVMSWAVTQVLKCTIRDICLDDLIAADEIFIVNSAFGLWPVRSFQGYNRDRFPISLRIQNWLNHEDE